MRSALLLLLSLLYPLAVWLALGRLEPRWIALLLFALAALRALGTREPTWISIAVAAAVLAILSTVLNAAVPLKLYPVAVNATLLTVFAISLIKPPSAIERLARLREPNLPAAAIAYTRRVTQVWCGFFVFNGSLALLTALYADEALWALYNGLVAYLLMGLLLAGEWLLRRRMRAAHRHG